jgi:hypothetical protein
MRKQLVREQSSHVLRVQKAFEDADIKLDSVLTGGTMYHDLGCDHFKRHSHRPARKARSLRRSDRLSYSDCDRPS